MTPAFRWGKDTKVDDSAWIMQPILLIACGVVVAWGSADFTVLPNRAHKPWWKTAAKAAGVAIGAVIALIGLSQLAVAFFS